MDRERKLIFYALQTKDYSIDGTDNRKKSVLLQPLPIIFGDIEEPFGHDSNDLSLDFTCNTMLRNVESLIANAPSKHYFCNYPKKVA